MSTQPLTKAERDELRRVTASTGRDAVEMGHVAKWYCAGCRKMHSRCECGELLGAIVPALLADLDAAEARHNGVMVDLAACVCRAEKADGEVRALRAERDATEAALREFCVLAHENRGDLAAIGMMAALNKLGLWREPNHSEAPNSCNHPESPEGSDDGDGCPKSDPDCMGRSDECHDACETPKGPACGHSACSQHFVDTGSTECVEDKTDGS